MTHRIALLILPLALATIALGPKSQDPEDDERGYELALGKRTMEQNCLMCHSVEMIASQRLTPTQWTAVVDKMTNWGAPVPPEEKARLLDFLTTSYAPSVPAQKLERLAASDIGRKNDAFVSEPLPSSVNLTRGQATFKAQCAVCHGESAIGGALGTNLVSHRSLLSVSGFVAVVQDGRRRMPGFSRAISRQDELDALAWLRSLEAP